jgi:CheY-like chemotaxis protein
LAIAVIAARNVLVVDDEAMIRGILALVLEDEGYSVTTAANGQQALDIVRRQLPDAVLLDLMMPVVDGWDVIKACRADPSTSTIPIIAISAVGGGQIAEKLDVQAFLPKPFDINRVLDVLHDVLR